MKETESKQIIEIHEVHDDYYDLGPWKIPRLILAALALIFYLIYGPLPLKRTLKTQALGLITSNPFCPLKVQSFDFSYFPPSIDLKDLSPRGSCFNQVGSSFHVKEIIFGLTRPSFSPIGVKFDGKVHIDKGVIPLEGILSPTQTLINIPQGNLPLTDLTPLFGGMVAARGTVGIRAQAQMQKNILDRGSLNLAGEDIFLNSLSLGGFELPSMRLGPFQLIAKAEGQSNVNIERFVLGDSTTNLEGDATGSIRPSWQNAMLTQLEVAGRFRLSQEILEQFSVLTFFLKDKKVDSEGFYKFDLKGSVVSPQFTFK